MGYLSHLVEAGEMEWIEMRFLVVGHTHCSIDQYFSVLSNYIASCPFIPTPMAMRHVLAVAHDKDGMRPLVVRPLNVSLHSNSRNLIVYSVNQANWICTWIRRSLITRATTRESFQLISSIATSPTSSRSPSIPGKLWWSTRCFRILRSSRSVLWISRFLPHRKVCSFLFPIDLFIIWLFSYDVSKYFSPAKWQYQVPSE